MDQLNVVTLNQAKLWLRVDLDYEYEDALITSLIKAAVNQVEQYTMQILWQREFLTKTDPYGRCRIFEYPLISIESVVDKDGNDQEYKEVQTNWYTEIRSDVGDIQTVTFVAGYGWTYDLGSEVPQDIITAIKELLAYLYENRDNPKADWPVAVTYLLGPYRRITLF